jgi:hypothetical protein
MKLRRYTSEGHRQTISVPRHRELRLGTLHEIYQEAALYVPEELLREAFYTD